jgi:hypothetical protein
VLLLAAMPRALAISLGAQGLPMLNCLMASAILRASSRELTGNARFPVAEAGTAAVFPDPRAGREDFCLTFDLDAGALLERALLAFFAAGFSASAAGAGDCSSGTNVSNRECKPTVRQWRGGEVG